MIFVADENFSTNLTKILAIFDRKNAFKHLTESHGPGTKDVVWIPEVAKWRPQPVILGGDGRILKRDVELQVLKQANLTFVYLAEGYSRLPWEQQVIKLLSMWPKIVLETKKVKRPTIFELRPKSRKLQNWGPTEQFMGRRKRK